MRKRWIAPLAWIPVAALMGCAQEAGDTEAGAADTAMAEAPAAAETADAAVEMDMEARNESGITGEARIQLQTDGLLVTVDLDGVEAGTEYASHIHSGTCEQPGGVVVPLESVPGAEGSASTSVGVDQLPPGQSYLIMSHGAGGQPVACGDVPEDWRAQLGGQGGSEAAGTPGGTGGTGGAQGS